MPVVEAGERYRLDWVGKTEAYRTLQATTTSTLRPKREQSVNFDTANHVFIEGENLETLKVIQKAYFGQVKLIYIDPPYNTGSDNFVYPDRFGESKEEYLRRINELDEQGALLREGQFRKNSRESGHYHSNWLSMMLPRLYIARNLLKDDGVIFVSCDDNEVFNLRCLMNEIFGEENFVATVIWQKVYSPKNSARHFSEDHDYVLYMRKLRQNGHRIFFHVLTTWSRDIQILTMIQEGHGRQETSDCAKLLRKRNLCDYVPLWERLSRGLRRVGTGLFGEGKLQELDKDNRIWWGKDGNNMPAIKRFLSEVKQGRSTDAMELR